MIDGDVMGWRKEKAIDGKPRRRRAPVIEKTFEDLNGQSILMYWTLRFRTDVSEIRRPPLHLDTANKRWFRSSHKTVTAIIMTLSDQEIPILYAVSLHLKITNYHTIAHMKMVVDR